MLRLLSNRNFALLVLAGLLSGLGGTMLYVALPFYVYQRTGSTLATGAIFIIELVPSLLAGSLAGVFVDRWDRRRTMITADVARTLLILSLLLVRSAGWLWLVYAVAFLESCVGLFFDPASSALLPRLVGEDQLVAANSLRVVSFNIMRLTGPALGGAVLGLLGLQAVVAVDSASYLCSAVLIGLIRTPRTPAETAQQGASVRVAEAAGYWAGLWSEWLAGLRLVWHDRALRALFVVMGGTMVADGFYLVLLVPFVRVILHGDALTFGWVQGAIGLGGLLGGLLTGYLGTIIRPRRLLTLSIGGMGVLTLVLANARSLPLVLLLGGLLGVPVTGLLVSQDTLLQTTVPDPYRGRVLATYGTTITLLLLCSMGLASLLAAPLGPASTLDVAGGLYLGAAALALLVLHEPLPDARGAQGQGEGAALREGDGDRPTSDAM